MKNVKSKPFIIGLTGGIATGKSRAAKVFKDNGFIVIDSDEIVKELYLNNNGMLKKIEAIFKIDYKNPNFKKQLSEIVFNDKAKLEILNDIVHPYVFKKIKEIVKKYKKEKYLVIDMPLLIEVGYKVDHILLIYASKETQINRVIKRDNLSYNDALKRVESQMDIELKKTYANTIINNEIDLDIELNQFIGGLINEK